MRYFMLTTARHDLAQLLLPVSLKHLISFIDDGVPACQTSA